MDRKDLVAFKYAFDEILETISDSGKWPEPTVAVSDRALPHDRAKMTFRQKLKVATDDQLEALKVLMEKELREHWFMPALLKKKKTRDCDLSVRSLKGLRNRRNKGVKGVSAEIQKLETKRNRNPEAFAKSRRGADKKRLCSLKRWAEQHQQLAICI